DRRGGKPEQRAERGQAVGLHLRKGAALIEDLVVARARYASRCRIRYHRTPAVVGDNALRPTPARGRVGRQLFAPACSVEAVCNKDDDLEGAGLKLPNEVGVVEYLSGEFASERGSVLARERERLVLERIAQLCDVAKIHHFLERRRARDLRTLKDD